MKRCCVNVEASTLAEHTLHATKVSHLLSELCKSHHSLMQTKQLHALIIRTHLVYDPFFATKILGFYSINSDVLSARKQFDKTPNRSIYLWNSMIRAYAKVHKLADVFSLFTLMIKSDIRPDNFTFACIIRACSENFYLNGLRLVHGRTIISGLGFDSISNSALVTAYSKVGLVNEASQVFCRSPDPDLVIFNSMISGYGYSGLWHRGLKLFKEMQIMDKKPDGYTLIGLFSGLSGTGLLKIGQGLHGCCLKTSFDSVVYIGSALLSMYSRCNCLNSALKVFESLSQLDLVTWSALITVFSRSGDYQNALVYFKRMNTEGIKPDFVLIATVLSACAQSAILGPGSEIHGYILRNGFESDITVTSSLIDMYSKCGFLTLGIQVFEIMPHRNIISYNSAISGLGLYGFADKAFNLFDNLLERGLQPDESTFSALLSACCHSGHVKEGRDFFRRMRDEFAIEARTEHCVHMVKLLGMEGELEEAYNLILSLEEPVDCGIWGALLSCCDFHGNSELGEIVAQKLIENSPRKSVYIVMLSNLYAVNKRWVDVEKLRDNMVRKFPGVSWIGANTI